MTVYSNGRTKLLLFFILSGCVSLFITCKKNTETIGADFLGPRSGLDVRSTDTATLVVYSSRHDSVPTRSLNYQMLGSLNDPDLGTTQANIYSQVSLPVDAFTFNGKTVDSVVLQLKFATESSIYGKASASQEFKVYQLGEPLYNAPDSLYYSNRTYALGQQLGSYTGPLHMSDATDSLLFTLKGSTIVNRVPPHVRIHLNKSFLENAPASAFVNDAAFRSYLNGIAVVSTGAPSSNDGGLTYINMRAATSAIVVYYGATHSSGVQEMASFPLGGDNIKTNQFLHANQPAGLMLQPYRNGTHANRTYVQPAAGIKTRIVIPHLLDFMKNQRVGLIGAEVVFTMDATSEASGYAAPYKLLLVGSDSLGRNTFLKDIYEGDSSYYGGSRKLSASGETEYRFSVIRELQSILNLYKATGQDANYGMNLIVATDFPVQANRVILNNDRLNRKVKLNLTYTVIR